MRDFVALLLAGGAAYAVWGILKSRRGAPVAASIQMSPSGPSDPAPEPKDSVYPLWNFPWLPEPTVATPPIVPEFTDAVAVPKPAPAPPRMLEPTPAPRPAPVPMPTNPEPYPATANTSWLKFVSGPKEFLTKPYFSCPVGYKAQYLGNGINRCRRDEALQIEKVSGDGVILTDGTVVVPVSQDRLTFLSLPGSRQQEALNFVRSHPVPKCPEPYRIRLKAGKGYGAAYDPNAALVYVCESISAAMR